MAAEIKRDEATRISKKLQECRLNLNKENIYSCITSFRDALDKMLTTRMLPADEKDLRKTINTFQDDLAASRGFRQIYGPVTFKDDDFETSLDFMKQLIVIKEEEIQEALDAQQKDAEAAGQEEELQRRIHGIMVVVERGDFANGREMADKDEEAADALIEMYNNAGIEFRKQRDFEKAVSIFRKAIFIRPDDEGLHYNLARTFIEIGDWKAARQTMEETLQKNPDFPEGKRLLTFIRNHLNS